MKPEIPKKTQKVADIMKQNMDAATRWNLPGMVNTEALKIKKDAEVVSLAGNEIVAIENHDDEVTAYALRETCENPNEVNAEASRTRMELVLNLGAEAMVLVADTAETIGAKNSLEKMLAGQIGVTHYLTMNLARNINELTMYDVVRPKDSLDRIDKMASIVSKYTAAYSRLAKVMQGHYQTLQKMRTGGRQTVTVQHVQVAANQAIVANRFDSGGGEKSEG